MVENCCFFFPFYFKFNFHLFGFRFFVPACIVRVWYNYLDKLLTLRWGRCVENKYIYTINRRLKLEREMVNCVRMEGNKTKSIGKKKNFCIENFR